MVTATQPSMYQNMLQQFGAMTGGQQPTIAWNNMPQNMPQNMPIVGMQSGSSHPGMGMGQGMPFDQLPWGWGPSSLPQGHAFGTHGMRGMGGPGQAEGRQGGSSAKGGDRGGQAPPLGGSPGGFLPQMYPPMFGGPMSMPIPGYQSGPQMSPMFMPNYGQW